jgi:peptide/nickel transport system substrate-binding protein
MTPRPHGSWGLTAQQLGDVEGYGDAEKGKEQARGIMRQLGYSAEKPLKVTVTTRQTSNYVDAATWMLGELKLVYFDPTLEIVEDGVWHPKVSRREYAIGLNATGSGIDDPDVTFVENFSCDSLRNYSGYCNRALEKEFTRQSEITDLKDRLKLANEIERKLVEDVARISLGFRVNYNARHRYVKNFVGHNTNYNWPLWADVWLDK